MNLPSEDQDNDQSPISTSTIDAPTITHNGKLITDATACPQDIAYPTDLNLLNDAREKAEEFIDILYDSTVHSKKPRTYREIARKRYLQTAQKKVKTKKEIKQAVRRQLNYLRRNIKSINHILDAYPSIPLDDDYSGQSVQPFWSILYNPNMIDLKC